MEDVKGQSSYIDRSGINVNSCHGCERMGLKGN